MKALVFYVIALSELACVRAQLSPVEKKDSGPESSAPKPDALACYQPVTGCTSPAGGASCDPVCQTGTCDNWCTQKCSIAGDGTTGCSKKGAVEPPNQCTIWSQDTAGQYDDCKPGAICLPIPGTINSYCFTQCRSSADCVGAATPCTERSLTTAGAPTSIKVKVCDLPYTKCDSSAPLGGGCCNPTPSKNSGCGAEQTCYLVSPTASTLDPSQDNLTVCDFAQGTGTKRAPCSSGRDCADGWSCNRLSALGSSGGTCQQVCDPTDTSNPCPGGGICTLVGKQYGFCPP